MRKSDYEDLNVAQRFFYEHRRELLARLNGRLAKIDLEELAQRVGYELRKIDDETFVNLEHPRAFIFKIIKRRAIDLDRQDESRTGHGSEVPVDSYEPLWLPSTPASNPEDTMIAALYVEEIWNRLNDEEQQLLSYYFFDGRKSKEIAQLTGLSPDVVRKRLSRLLKKLREDPP